MFGKYIVRPDESVGDPNIKLTRGNSKPQSRYTTPVVARPGGRLKEPAILYPSFPTHPPSLPLNRRWWLFGFIRKGKGRRRIEIVKDKCGEYEADDQ